jgi:hypothetical protein
MDDSMTLHQSLGVENMGDGPNWFQRALPSLPHDIAFALVTKFGTVSVAIQAVRYRHSKTSAQALKAMCSG